jgi:transposase
VAVVRPGYKNFYAYSAVRPAASGVQDPHLTAGEDFTLLLPRVNTGGMGIFLGEMAGTLGGRRCILVMDRAGWHVSRDLKVPPNTRIVLLPSHSPEPDPVERLWRWPKRRAVRNRLHLTLESVVDAVEGCPRKTTAVFQEHLPMRLFIATVTKYGIRDSCKTLVSVCALPLRRPRKRVRLCSRSQPVNFVGVAKLRFATGYSTCVEKILNTR